MAPGDRRLMARDFNALVDAVRTLQNIRGGRGIRVTMGAGGLLISTRPEGARLSQGGAPQWQPVVVRLSTGQAGDANNPCTYRYDGWPLGADTDDMNQRVFIDLAPLAPRTDVGKHEASSGSCPAWAIVIPSRGDPEEPEWLLWYLPGERWSLPAPCNPCTP